MKLAEKYEGPQVEFPYYQRLADILVEKVVDRGLDSKGRAKTHRVVLLKIAWIRTEQTRPVRPDQDVAPVVGCTFLKGTPADEAPEKHSEWFVQSMGYRDGKPFGGSHAGKPYETEAEARKAYEKRVAK